MCIVAAGALLSAYLIGTASKEYPSNPTTGNLVWLGLSIVPGTSIGTRVAREVEQKTAGQMLRNGNNVLRIGNGRVSLGTAPSRFGRLPWWQKVMNPVHVHTGKNSVGFDLNWINKSFYWKW